MTRRERLERKQERRLEWADSRAAKANQEWERGDLSEEKSGIPFGQPILVGHHSEGKHRRAIERAENAMRRAHEHSEKAKEHAEKAQNIQRQLDRSIFSDDDNAVQELEARIAEREAQAARIVEYNKSARTAAKAGEKHGNLSLLDEAQKRDLLETLRVCPYHSRPGAPMPGYVLSNLRGRINADRERLERIKAN